MAAYYLEHLFKAATLRTTTREIVKFLRNKYPKKPKGLNLVGIGLSGSLVLPTISYLTGFPFIIIRKETENNHSFCSVECDDDGSISEWIFVDDLISSGTTLNKVIKEMKNYKQVGTILHYQNIESIKNKAENKYYEFTLNGWVWAIFPGEKPNYRARIRKKNESE